MNSQIIPYVFCQEVALYPLCNAGREGRKEGGRAWQHPNHAGHAFAG